MLTKHELATLSWVFSHASTLAAIPFEWDKNNFKLSVTKSKWKSTYHHFVNLFGVFYLIYNAVQFRKTFADYVLHKSADDVMIHVWYFAAQAIVLTINGTFVIFRDHVIIFINQSLGYHFSAGQKYFNRKFKPPHWREKAYRGLEVASYCTGCCFGLIWVANPTKHYVKYSGLIPNSWHCWEVLVVVDFVEMLQAITWAFSWTSFCSMLFVHFFGVKYWLYNCCYEWELPSKSSVQKHNIDKQQQHLEMSEKSLHLESNYNLGPGCQESIDTYKICYLLNNMFNEIFAPAAIPGLKYLTLFLTILPIYGFIRFHATMDILTTYQVLVLIPVAALSLIPATLVMTAIYDISTEFPKRMPLKILKETNGGREEVGAATIANKLSRKRYLAEVKSVLPLRCKVGSLYYMESQAKLTLFDVLVNALVFLLLNC